MGGHDHTPLFHPQHLAIAGDLVSAAAILGAFAGFLPPLAALGAIIWYVLQILESKTFLTWQRKQRRAKYHKRRAKHGRHIQSRHTSR